MFKKVSDLLGQNSFSNKSKSFDRQGKSGPRPSEFFDFLTLIARWNEVVGDKLAKVTVPLKNQNKTLTILTNHSGYSQSLSMMEETIKAKIFAIFPELKGKVGRLNFIVSTQHFDKQRADLLQRASSHKSEAIEKKKAQTLHPQSPQYKKLKKEALEQFSDLDEDLKEQMVSIYIQNKSQDSSN